MPTHIRWIASVKEQRVQNRHTHQWFSRFTIYARQSPTEPWSETYQTTNAFKASLCQEASRLGRPLVIGSRDNWYGPDLITVEWAEQEVAS